MNDIRALLKIAARRLEINSFIDYLHGTGIVCAAVALALMICDRAVAAPFVPWIWVGPALAGVAVVFALVLWSRRRPTPAHVALVVDERLDLREKLSTALHCQGRDDAFALAAVEDAVSVARDRRTHEQVRRRFNVTAPRAWWISPLIVLGAIIISFIRPLDLFARDPQNNPTVKQAKLEAEQSVDAIVKAIQEKPELSKELGAGEPSKQGTDPNALRKPDDIKRDAIKTITDYSKKLDELINGEKGKTNEALDKALSQLKTPEDGAAKELAQALAKGNFSQAQEALQKLMEKAENGQLNDEDKKKAAEQLQNIADQLKKLAEQQKQLEDALKQAGLDQNLAKNPQALQQAIQNAQNLNQQQKQQLQQMAQAQQGACKMCQGLGQACQQMAQACQGGKPGQMGKAGQQMAQQLGQIEQLQQLLQQAQAAANQCQGQCKGLGQGLNMQQAMQQWKNQGNGMGKHGFGAGGNAPNQPTPWGKKAEQGNVQTVEGDIIAKQLFDGEQIRGDSKAKLVQVIESARKGFDEGLTEDQMHIRYRDAYQHYFGELDKLTKPVQSDNGSKDKAAAEKPAEKPAAEGSSSGG